MIDNGTCMYRTGLSVERLGFLVFGLQSFNFLAVKGRFLKLLFDYMKQRNAGPVGMSWM